MALVHRVSLSGWSRGCSQIQLSLLNGLNSKLQIDNMEDEGGNAKGGSEEMPSTGHAIHHTLSLTVITFIILIIIIRQIEP